MTWVDTREPPRDDEMSGLSPGTARPEVIDLHCHGAVGYGFDTADKDGVAAAVAFHRQHGTDEVMLSLVSAPIETLLLRMRELSEIVPAVPGAIGVHLEGPFLSPHRSGAHDPDALILPTDGSVSDLIAAGAGVLRQVTIAPELPGAMAAIDRFVAAGVTVAIGHTQADHDVAGAAFDRGARLLTHAFNAMPGLGHRETGPIGAALERDHVVLEVIADGLHLSPVVIRTLFAAAPDRVALVTDSISSTGLGDGNYRLGDMDIRVEAGRSVLAETQTLAGSTLTMARAVQVAISSGVPVEIAVAAVSSTPRRVLEWATNRGR